MEWTKRKYNEQYESWMPWVEDQYLKWFTKDNKASYATKGTYPIDVTSKCSITFILFCYLRCLDTLGKSKVTGVNQVDTLQDGVNNLVAGQVGQGGLAQPIGDLASKEGVNRAERQGKDDKGGYTGNSYGDSAMNAAKGAGDKLGDGAKGAGGYVSSFWGGKKAPEGQDAPSDKK
jgi:hypothetical protein